MKLPKLSGNTALGAHTRGTLYALVITLASILLFAILVNFAGISDAVIKPIIQIIKALSIFTGVYLMLKRIEKRAWMHGGILGLVYTMLAFFILSIIDSDFSITGSFLIESLFALAVGIASALLLRLRKRDI